MTMKQSKRKALEQRGYKISDTAEFLGLTEEEAAYVEMKVTLAKSVKSLRKSKGLSQVEVAKSIGSSQSRIAKMEAGDPSVSTDMMLKTLLALGATRKDIGKALAARSAA